MKGGVVGEWKGGTKEDRTGRGGTGGRGQRPRENEAANGKNRAIYGLRIRTCAIYSRENIKKESIYSRRGAE